MHVGFSTDASPLLPRIILLLVSMSVVGVEYPMGTPVNKQTLSASNSNTCAKGKNLQQKYTKWLVLCFFSFLIGALEWGPFCLILTQ